MMRGIQLSMLLWAIAGCDDGASRDPVPNEMVEDAGADGQPTDAGLEDALPMDRGLDARLDGGENDASPPAMPGWAPAPTIDAPIQEIAVVAIDDALYVIGGFDAQARVVNTVSRFEPATGEWRSVAPIPVRMHHANAAVVDGRIWVLGFLTGLDFGADPRGFIYDPEADSWSPGPSLPDGFARGAAGTVAIGSTIYIVGGMSGRAVYPFVHAYDTTTEAWTQLPDLPTMRDHMAIGAVNDQIVVAGGRAGAIGSHVDRVDLFDPAQGEWRSGAAMPTSRGGVAAAVLGGELFVIGGEGNANAGTGVFDEVEAYDLAADQWRVLDPMVTPRHGMWAATINGRIYVPGGATRQAFGAVDTHEVLVP